MHRLAKNFVSFDSGRLFIITYYFFGEIEKRLLALTNFSAHSVYQNFRQNFGRRKSQS